MGDEATPATADPRDEEDVEKKPDKQRNPVRRAHLYAKFVDGKWWTPAGMAGALGSDLANDLAVRYYRYKLSSDLEGRPVGEILQAARKKCVSDVLKGIPATLAETKEEEGQIFYRLKQQTTVRVTADVKPKVQKEPAQTETGLTTAGVLAAISELGGKCDLEALVEKLKPAMVADEKLIAWAKKTSGSRNRKVVDAITIDDARRSAVTMMCERARGSHDVKIVRTVTIEYTPPKEGEDGDPPPEAPPAEPAADKTTE
jgi:hypothetical protein